MLISEFLRHQAQNCLRLARTCFDLTSAERLRLIAAELQAKAEEIDNEQTFGSAAFSRYSSSSRENDHG